MKNFISVNDVGNIDELIFKALRFKENPHSNIDLGRGKRIGLLFLNPSLRTRLSTQVAAQNLGMEAIVFNVDKEGWTLEFEEGVKMDGNTVEHIKDAAPVLGSYFDILCIRTFPSLKNRAEDYSENYIHKFIKYCGVPVVSLESATLHPLQSLTDLITINECWKNNNKKAKVVLTWAPHVKPLPQCVANSFSQWMTRWNVHNFIICQPKGFELNSEFTDGAKVLNDQEEALKDADFVYVKNWSSYSQYGEMPSVDMASWMLNTNKLQTTNSAKVLHCLPVRRNVELSDEVLDGPNSIVTLQAANRVWAAQAVIAELLNSLHGK